jgi:hypothetical protein
MGKLYLPTSTLNFNNIFSVESISPASFYAQRNFGYRRFTIVEPNPFQNSLLLYNKYPKFSINDRVNDNYPMIFELDDTAILEKMNCVFEKDDLKIFQLPSSLYLDPFSIEIYFDSQQHLQTTIIKSEPSIESKLVEFYRPNFKIESSELNSFVWSPSLLKDLVDVSDNLVSKEIVLDKKIDSIKGFITCYLIGANQVSPAEIIELKQLARNIRNDVSSILNLFSVPSFAIEKSKPKKVHLSGKELTTRLSDLEKFITRFVDLIEALAPEQRSRQVNESEVLGKYNFFGEDVEKVLNLLKVRKVQGITLYEYFRKSIDEFELGTKSGTLTDNLRKLLVEFNQAAISKNFGYANFKAENYERIFLQMENELSKIEKKYQGQSPKLNFSDTFSISNLRLTNYFDKFSLTKSTFYPSLVNEFLDMAVGSTEEFKLSRIDLAVAGGKIFRESMGSAWEGSEERSYINGLLSHVQSYTPFSIKSHLKIMLQAFAAFIIKGDDPEKMIDFLIANQVQDFRLALGLWGSVFGFAAIPRTLTKGFYTYGDDFFIQYYKSIANQILNFELEKIEFKKIAQLEKPIISQKVTPSIIKSDSYYGLTSSSDFGDKSRDVQNKIIDSVLSEVPKCPLCGVDMVERAAKTGRYAGKKFWGCPNYPRCEGTIYPDESNPAFKSKIGSGDNQKPTELSDPKLFDYQKSYDFLEELIIEFMHSMHENHIKINDVLKYIKKRTKKDYTVGNIESLINDKFFKRLVIEKKDKSAGIRII